MNVDRNYGIGFVYQNFQSESEIKLDIINVLFEDFHISFVEDSAKNNILDKKMQKFSCESLKRLCDDLLEIFNNYLQHIFENGYTDPMRANILEKFLDANESDWPDLLNEVIFSKG